MRLSPVYPCFTSLTSSSPHSLAYTLTPAILSLLQSHSHLSRSRLSSENDITPSKKPPLAHSKFCVSILLHDWRSSSSPPSYTLLHVRTLQTSFLLCQLDPCWASSIQAHLALLCFTLSCFTDVTLFTNEGKTLHRVI